MEVAAVGIQGEKELELRTLSILSSPTPTPEEGLEE
jgi:hypothetical protein